MDHGHILALDTPEGLKSLIPGGLILDLSVRVAEPVLAGPASNEAAPNGSPGLLQEALSKLPGVTKIEQVVQQSESQTQGYRLYANSNVGSLLASAVQAVLQAQGELLDVRFTRPSLEDVFIYLTGRNLRI